MPPPELFERAAPASVGSLVLGHLRAEAPVARHAGPRATEAHLRGLLAAANETASAEMEREAAIALARHLASRGRDLATAVAAATRALELGEDRTLLVELAGWLAGLGDGVGAAATLERTISASATPQDAARTLVKMAVLFARAGDADRAVRALDEAATLDPKEGLAVELFATLSSWAPETVTRESAAAAFLEAARRRAEAGDADAAYEDRLRAFDAAPEYAEAADAVAEALASRGRGSAADELLRLHAVAVRARDEADARRLHRQRLLAALKDGDGVRAVGATLDAALEGTLEGDDADRVGGDPQTPASGDRVDEALAMAGLYELLAVRLEMREDHTSLARLYAGPLASPERAMSAWIEAFVGDRSNEAALAALRDHALEAEDPEPLAEAWIRVALSGEGERRRTALREIVELAARKLVSPALGVWAERGLAELADGAASPTFDKASAREDEGLEAARHALAVASSPEARIDALRMVLAAYQARPGDRPSLVRAAAELARALPNDRAARHALDRAVRRAGDTEALEKLLRERIQAAAAGEPTPKLELSRAHLTLSRIARRRGDDAAALAAARAVLAESPGNPAAACAALFLATRAGRPKERADAIVQIAEPLSGAIRATLLAVAADLYVATGDEAAARRAAGQAVEADPTCARAITTLSSLADVSHDRVAAAAVERALTTVLPRADWCAELARSYDELGEHGLALAWTQRWLALRPGSLEAMVGLLSRAVATGDAGRIGEALGWVLAQPRPLADLVDAITAALTALLDIEPREARGLARRALDVLGPQNPSLRSRLIAFATLAADPGLAIAVLERHLATTPDPAERRVVLLDLAQRRAAAGDHDGAALELLTAAREGGDAQAILAELTAEESAHQASGESLGSDGRVAVADARALALSGLGAERAEAAAAAFRELGSLRWDLAHDRVLAEQAFYQAAELSPDGGVERYSRDLLAFGGVRYAIDALTARADSLVADEGDEERPPVAGDPKRRASLLIEAANLANENGMPERALAAAAAAIESDPTRADIVGLVERNAQVAGGIAILDRTYDLLAGAALGCFGRRAAHHRAARVLERRGAVEPALRHAASCFEAVPSEGTSLVLLTRLSERAGDPTEAVRALERVAEAADRSARPVWFKRAAQLAATGPDGARARFDLLLRALNARPDPTTVADVASAVRGLTGDDEDATDDDAMTVRCERAVSVALRRLDGPDGARAAIAMASLALDLHAPELAFTALDKAMEADGDVEEFASLEAQLPALAEGGAAGRAWVDGVKAAADKPYSSVGKALMLLASRLAASLRAPESRVALLLMAIRRVQKASGMNALGPEDDALVEEADEAVRSHGDPAILEELDRLVGPAARAEAAVRLAERAEREGLEEDAIAFLDRAIESGALDMESKSKASLRLQTLLARVGRHTDVEALLRSELERGSLTPTAHGRIAHDLADLLLKREQNDEAFEVLAALATRGGPPDPDLLAEMRGLARATNLVERYAEVLSIAVPLARDDASRLEILRELAPIHAELGAADLARECYEAIGQLDPTDVQALEVLEVGATARGDFVEFAKLLARRIALTPAGDKKRMLRLRRAAVLEQRLGFLDEAARELGAQLAETPDDPSALRFLADIHERNGSPIEAAALLAKLEGLAETAEEKAEYGVRAGAAYLAGGELVLAGRTIDRIASIAPAASRESITGLRVELARANGDARAEADALEELAASSVESDEARANFLLEASRAASAGGDDVTAIDRVKRALKLWPSHTEVALEARRLEYKVGGAGTPREAQAAVEELQRIESRVAPTSVDLHAFLLAEELDVIQGGGAGMRMLSRRHAELGQSPLLALGMAERLVRGKNFEAALPLFQAALAGDLRGLRPRGRVALAAAEAAIQTQAFTTATELLDIAADEADTRAQAERRQLELAAMIGDPAVAREALDELLANAVGIDRARLLLQLARLVLESEPELAEDLLAEATPLASGDRSLPGQIAATLHALRHGPDDEEEDPDEPVHELVVRASPPPLPAPKPLSLPPPLPVPGARTAAVPPRPPAEPKPEPEPATPLAPIVAAVAPTTGSKTEEARTEPRTRDPAPSSAGEAALEAELAAGSFEAGEQLLALRGASQHGSLATLAVRRQQASIRLGDRVALQRLLEAAVVDGDPGYARSIEHVMHTWGPKPSTLPAPPLATQRLAPDLTAALLFRPVTESKVHEALALVLETGLYRRDVGQYQLTGVARVQPTGGSVLGEVFAVVSRYLGQPRTPLFHRRAGSSGPHSAVSGPASLAAGAGAPASYKVALLSPPAIVMSGEVREETPELRYLLGEAVTGVMPEHALVNALAEEALRTLIEALHAAFGPVLNADGGPRSSAGLPRGNPEVARLGQNLWQLVPPRADRRLRELCADLGAISYEAAVSGTRQAMRRAGLFVSGSLPVALAKTASELGIDIGPFEGTPDGLSQACAQHPAIADLVRLAIGSEFAESRWTSTGAPASSGPGRWTEPGIRAPR